MEIREEATMKEGWRNERRSGDKEKERGGTEE